MDALPSRRQIEAELSRLGTTENIRADLGEIDELAASISSQGLIAPLLVREDDDGSLTVIAGRRRLEALRLICNPNQIIPCLIADSLDEAEVQELMLTENIQREALSELDEARSLKTLLDLRPQITAGRLAASLGKSPGWISKRLSLLDLPDEVQNMLDEGDLSFSIADMLGRGRRRGRINDEQITDLAERAKNGDIDAAALRLRTGPAALPPVPEQEEINDNTVVKNSAERRAQGREARSKRNTQEQAYLDSISKAASIEASPDSWDNLLPEEEIDPAHLLEAYVLVLLANMAGVPACQSLDIPDEVGEWAVSLSEEDIVKERRRLAALLKARAQI